MVSFAFARRRLMMHLNIRLNHNLRSNKSNRGRLVSDMFSHAACAGRLDSKLWTFLYSFIHSFNARALLCILLLLLSSASSRCNEHSMTSIKCPKCVAFFPRFGWFVCCCLHSFCSRRKDTKWKLMFLCSGANGHHTVRRFVLQWMLRWCDLRHILPLTTYVPSIHSYTAYHSWI